MELTERIARAVRWIAGSEHVIALTGAGISTESGLPDFRGPDGVWTRRDKGLPPKRLAKPWSEVEPNAGHRALVALARRGKLRFLISQNVDNLHRKSGIADAMLAELHGNTVLARCLGCDTLFERDAIGFSERRFGARYRTDEPHPDQPPCPDCGGRLVSSVVNFGDPMPGRELRDAERHAAACEVMLVIGTSLQVAPACELVDDALEGGAKVVLINRGDTPYDELVSLRFREGAGAVLGAIVAGLQRD